jgi:uncharacterized membrane protein
VRLSQLRETVRSSLWLVPAVCVVAAIGLAILLTTIDQRLGRSSSPLVFTGGPEAARTLLSTITSSMITFTGLVFSITVVVLQLTSSQFSPRVLRTFLDDRANQLALGVFTATFVYAMMVLRTVRSTFEGAAFVPQLATTVAFALVLLSVGFFIFYIHHITNSIRAASIITGIAQETRAALDRQYPRDGGDPVPPRPASVPTRTVPAPRAGVVVLVDERTLVRRAAEAGCVLALVPRVGDFVPTGAPLLEVLGEADGLDDERVCAAVRFGAERTLQQDAAFGFRQLADIADRALSPGVNDPTTALQVIDQLHDLLRRLATRRFPTGRLADDHGALRLLVPVVTWEGFLTVAVDELAQYARESHQVLRRVRSMLTDLRGVARPEHLAALDRRLATVGDPASDAVGR